MRMNTQIWLKSSCKMLSILVAIQMSHKAKKEMMKKILKKVLVRILRDKKGENPN